MQEFASMVGLPPEMGSFLLEVLLAGVDSIPFVSNVLDAIRFFTGIDPLTGRVLSKKEQWTVGFFAIIPGGGGLKAIKNVINLAIDGYKTAKKLKTANNTTADIRKATNPEPGGTLKQGTGCGNCFPAGTLVQTKDGPKAIETLQIGDEVLSKSDTTGEISYKEIEQTFTRIADEVYTLTIGENGREVRATGDHPFFVHDIGWVRTQNLQVGDELETKWGMTLEVKKVEVKQEETRVYNLSVADYHTYFVTDLLVFTHNQGPCGKGDGSSHVTTLSKEGIDFALSDMSRVKHGYDKHAQQMGFSGRWRADKESWFALNQEVLSSPSKSFDHKLGSTEVKGFYKKVDGLDVAVFIYKEGPHQGKIATTFEPSSTQLSNWGIQ